MKTSRACYVARVATLALTFAGCKARAPVGEHPPAPARAPEAMGAEQHPATTLVATALVATATVRPRPLPLSVPRAPKPVRLSSEFDVATWGRAVNTHTLLDDTGQGAVPVSEARFLWGNGHLYVHFYAGDLDLEVREKKRDGAVYQDDSVTLAFFDGVGGKRMLTVSPTGVLADGSCPADATSLADPRCDMRWNAHARVAFDYDGTLNQLGDFDEEWNVELAIPLPSLAAHAASGTHIPFALSRCDMAFDGQRACGAWGSSSDPAELILE